MSDRSTSLALISALRKAGSYGGVTASATAVVGAGANLLVGGTGNAISLQPLSIEGNTGLNVAAGVAGLTLTYQPG